MSSFIFSKSFSKRITLLFLALITLPSLYQLSQINRKETNFLKSLVQIKYNSFNKSDPIKIHLFQISLIREFELAKLGYKNTQCDPSELKELLLKKLNRISNKMPVDLKIIINLELVSAFSTLFAIDMELEQVDIEIVSRVLLFSYQSSSKIKANMSKHVSKFMSFQCRVVANEEDSEGLRVSVIMGDLAGINQYFRKAAKPRMIKLD